MEKYLKPFSFWLLRITFVFLIFLIYLPGLASWDLNSLNFYLSALSILGGAFLLIGGIARENIITLISALLLTILAAWGLFRSLPGIDVNFGNHLLRFSIAFFFLVKGNKS